MTFDQYVTENIAATRQPKPITIPAPVLASLKTTGILPTLPESPSVAEVAAVLLAKISEMHRLLVADPASRRAEKLISFQNLNVGFLCVLTLAGSFPESMEE